MRLDWSDLAAGRVDALEGAMVELCGWMAPLEPARRHDYFLLVAEPLCCLDCLPRHPGGAIEVFAAAGIAPQPGRCGSLGGCAG